STRRTGSPSHDGKSVEAIVQRTSSPLKLPHDGLEVHRTVLHDGLEVRRTMGRALRRSYNGLPVR
ncbi:MAG: hypothetical protein ACKOUR_18525, partial [Planctomycetota bacterium]